MSPASSRSSLACAAVVAVFVGLSIYGVSWGLPSRRVDRFLFGAATPWSGEKISRLAGAGDKLSTHSLATRGADVDLDPIPRPGAEPVWLTSSESDVARIYLRYRLYTYQPDEMITMMALAGMNPRALALDPRLYQYGGLFIYPVGALIAAAAGCGLVELRSDLTYYLDHPDAFARFYLVARLYVAVWGALGVVVVFAIARRLTGGTRAGLVAAALFTVLPVVVCMSHEGKPHLPGAVLMLIAVWLGMRSLDAAAPGPGSTGRLPRSFAAMCGACGAAVGMVINTWPILVLVPLAAWLGRSKERAQEQPGRWRRGWLARSIAGIAIAVGVYLVTNPYVPINALVNRAVLRSNFENSLAMYEVGRIGAGFLRVAELTIEGATVPVVVLGGMALVAGWWRRQSATLPLVVPAAIFFLQFVMVGAGKPAEYGRFGIFVNTALAIGAGCVIGSRSVQRRPALAVVLPSLVLIWTGVQGVAYLRSFRSDAAGRGTRLQLAERIERWQADGSATRPPTVAVLTEPAPYSCPPLNFAETRVELYPPSARGWLEKADDRLVVFPVDQGGGGYQAVPATDQTGAQPSAGPATPISWANKPFFARFPG